MMIVNKKRYASASFQDDHKYIILSDHKDLTMCKFRFNERVKLV